MGEEPAARPRATKTGPHMKSSSFTAGILSKEKSERCEGIANENDTRNSRPRCRLEHLRGMGRGVRGGVGGKG